MNKSTGHGSTRKRIAIVQSNYIPWKGYFDLIASVDEFILYDEVQYTRRDWRNRNRIKTPTGLHWLSVPVAVKGRYTQRIDETRINDSSWMELHWQTLFHNYRRAPCFDETAEWLEPIYRRDAPTLLSRVNKELLFVICARLGISTKLRSSSEYTLASGRNERLISICRQAGASTYVSGPAAKAYLDVSHFASNDITVEWFDYTGYPVYPQLWGKFVHEVSILDLLFNCGAEATRFMKCKSR